MIEKDDLTEKKRNRFKKKLVEDLSENIKLRFPALSYKHDVLYTSDVYSHTHVSKQRNPVARVNIFTSEPLLIQIYSHVTITLLLVSLARFQPIIPITMTVTVFHREPSYPLLLR